LFRKKKTFYPTQRPKDFFPSEWKRAAEIVNQDVRPSTLEESTKHNMNSDNQTSSSFRYSKCFLMSLRQKSHSPIEGLLEEVTPGYVDPSRTYCFPPCGSISIPNDATRYSVKSKSETSPKVGTPTTGGIYQVKDTSMKKVPSLEETNFELRSLREELPSLEPAAAPSTGFDANAAALKVKNTKKEKARETDERRLAARQKQIDIGTSTTGYKRYLETVTQRKKGDPKTPDKYQVCSKRSWDGQVRKWRRQLHQYDPDEIILDDEDFLREVNEEDIPALSMKLGINLTEIFAK